MGFAEATLRRVGAQDLEDNTGFPLVYSLWSPATIKGGSPVSPGVGVILQSQSIAYQPSTPEILQHPGSSSLALCEAQRAVLTEPFHRADQ